MGSTDEGSDLFLFYPHGSDDDKILRGAEILKQELKNAYGIKWEDIDITNTDTGDDEHGTDTHDNILQSNALAANFSLTRQRLNKVDPRRIFTLGGRFFWSIVLGMINIMLTLKKVIAE